MSRIERPEASEYDVFYETYVSKVPQGDILELLASQRDELARLLSSIDDERALYRYAEGKWSIKQVAGHLADAERILACRALCFARQERAALPGFDENEYVAAADFERRPLRSLITELDHLRGATVELFAGLSPDELSRRGTASGVSFSVRSFAFIIAGHERHHLGVLRDRYL
ncbi:MAG: DinB family protein [Acidobacteriota bacterium]|nr:DinB family protein [Acidobacteriota bacterium]